MPKITVLLTSYNHADYLKKSIDSILNQTFEDFELIIIDDCSSDNSWNIIKSYDDKRIIKIQHKKNKGYILTDDLVETFKGKYFAIAHCDDYWEKDKLEKQVNYLDNHDDVAACFTYVKLIDDDGNIVSSDKYVDFNVKNKNRYEWLNYFFYNGNCLCHPSILIRKEVQLKENLFTYGLKALPDFYRWVKLCLNHEIYVYPEQLSCFRVRKAGLNTSGYSFNNIVRCTYEVTKILELYKSLNDDDFIKVFPQSEKYKKKNYFNSSFALSRICIDEVGDNNYISFGLDIIYELLQDKINRESLLKYYNYSRKNFFEEVGNYDVYNSVDFSLVQSSSLYFKNKDMDYSEKNKLSNSFLLKNDGSFEILFSNINKYVDGLRFDPTENDYRSYIDICIYVNGNLVDFTSNCSKIEGDEIFFFHKDPYFCIDYVGKVNTVFITGKTSLISFDDVIEYTKDNVEKNILEKNLFYRIKKKFNKKSNN